MGRERRISTLALSRNVMHSSRPAGRPGLVAEVRYKLFRTSKSSKVLLVLI